MNATLRSMALALCLLSAACGGKKSSVGPQTLIVTPSAATVRLGKTVQFTNQGNSHTPSWSILAGPNSGVVSQTGLYRAPYFMPPTSTITVQATSGSLTSSAQVTVLDVPPDTADCAGDTPDFGEYVYVDELPEAIARVPPIYPEPAREAGIQGTVVIQALVCTSGMVFATRVVSSIPMLDEAAASAIRQWLFVPARAYHVPVAVWVAIPVRFTLHASPRVVAGPVHVLSLGGS
jgi:TonB family protein